VSGNCFQVLRQVPLAGRLIDDGDNAAESTRSWRFDRAETGHPDRRRIA